MPTYVVDEPRYLVIKLQDGKEIARCSLGNTKPFQLMLALAELAVNQFALNQELRGAIASPKTNIRALKYRLQRALRLAGVDLTIKGGVSCYMLVLKPGDRITCTLRDKKVTQVWQACDHDREFPAQNGATRGVANMPTTWLRREDGTLVGYRLASERISIRRGPGRGGGLLLSKGSEADGCTSMQQTIALGETRTVLITAIDGPPCAVNGEALRLGIRVLRHRDELALAGTRLAFSTDEPVETRPFEGRASASCPRCRDDLHVGAPSRRCAGCGVSYHEACFDAYATCSLCGRATDGSGEWIPEGM